MLIISFWSTYYQLSCRFSQCEIKQVTASGPLTVLDSDLPLKCRRRSALRATGGPLYKTIKVKTY